MESSKTPFDDDHRKCFKDHDLRAGMSVWFLNWECVAAVGTDDVLERIKTETNKSF